MRRSLLTLALPALLGLSLTSAAQAMPERNVSSPRAQAALNCEAGVVGAGKDKRVFYVHVKNDKVNDTSRSRTKLSFRPTAWGFYDSKPTKTGSVLRMNTVTSNGKPQRVTMTFKKGSKKFGVSSSSYDQNGFEPVLFADGYTYYAYAVNGAGKLQRWVLTRYRNGDLRFAQKVTIGSGYGDLTSLQSSDIYKSNGANREYLYATTATGALEQIAVPLKKPQNVKRRTLLDTGYAGVSELVWATCNGDRTYASLIAIDPVAGTATWTTVQHADANPSTTLRGPVTGGQTWEFTATY